MNVHTAIAAPGQKSSTCDPPVYDRAFDLGLKHIAWCRAQAMSPADVCLSVQSFSTGTPTWGDALNAVILRAEEIEEQTSKVAVFKSRGAA